jgi:MerR family redox-sensitive transcriptional activator SoxR
MPQTHTSDDDELVSVAAAARILGVHCDTVRRYEDRGLITALRTPGDHRRFRVGDLRRLLDAGAGAA